MEGVKEEFLLVKKYNAGGGGFPAFLHFLLIIRHLLIEKSIEMWIFVWTDAGGQYFVHLLCHLQSFRLSQSRVSAGADKMPLGLLK